jgi:hypothetical protein
MLSGLKNGGDFFIKFFWGREAAIPDVIFSQGKELQQVYRIHHVLIPPDVKKDNFSLPLLRYDHRTPGTGDLAKNLIGMGYDIGQRLTILF